MNSVETLAALKAATDFSPLGEAAGNLTLGKGQLQGQKVHLALMENRIASGSFGTLECEKLASLFRISATQKVPLILYLDSAGARVTQGLPALGAFRALYKAGCEAVQAGAPITAVIGANCYGGASMLAALAATRYFSENSQFAMSGPAILAQAAGGSALDDMFRAIAQAAIGTDSRVKLGAGNLLFQGECALPEPGHPSQGHRDLKEKLKLAPGGNERVQRKDLGLLYPEGYEIEEMAGVLHGHAQFGNQRVVVLGVVNRKPLGALQAWALADRIWQLTVDPPAHLHLLVDCDAHSASLDDERLMLSGYIADIALALCALAKGGTEIDCVVLGVLGGGAYVALTAGASRVSVVYGARVQLLPGKAIASILGDNEDRQYEIKDYTSAGVAERELRIGMVPAQAKA